VNAALALVALGVLAHWVGYKSQQTRLSLAALLLILWALPLYFRGWRAAWLMAFPCALLFFCIPLNFLDSAMIPARLLAAGLAAGLIRGFGFTAENLGAELVLTDAPGMRFLCIDPYSTLHAQLTILILAAVIGHLSQRSLPRQWLVFLAGGPAALLGNVVRLTAAGVAGHLGGPEALARLLAWSPVIVYAVALAVLGLWAAGLRRGPRHPAAPAEAPP
jgi:exosortase